MSYKFLFFSILVFFSMTFVSAEVYSYDIDEDGNVDYTHEVNRYDLDKFSKSDKESIKNLGEYASDSFQSEGKVGSIIYDDSLQTLTLYDSERNEIMVVPRGVELVFKDKEVLFSGVSERVVVGKEERTIYSDGRIYGGIGESIPASKKEIVDVVKRIPIQYKRVVFESTKDAKVRIVDNDGEVEMLIEEGSGSFHLAREHYDVNDPYEFSLDGVKDARIVVNEDNEIAYAKFVSVNGGQYRFTHGDNRISLIADKEGLIEFNPSKSIIIGENIREASGRGYYFDTGWRENDQDVNGEIKVYLDDLGNVDQIDFNNGYLSLPDGDFSSSKDFASVVFQSKIFDQLDRWGAKNLVLINGDEIRIKGNVDVEGLGGLDVLYYHGKEKSFLSFDKSENKFNMIEGDAIFGDLNYRIEIENGESLFKKMTDSSDYSDFGFEHMNVNGLVEEGIVTGAGMELKIKNNGEVVFDDFIEAELANGLNAPGDIIQSKNIALLKGEVAKVLAAKLAELDKNSDEWYELNLEKLDNDILIASAKGEKSIPETIFTSVKQGIAELESLTSENPGDEVYGELLAKYYQYAGDVKTQQIGTDRYTYRVLRSEDGTQDVVMYLDGEVYQEGRRVQTGIGIGDDGLKGTSFQGFEVQSATSIFRRLLGEQDEAVEFYRKAKDLGFISDEEFELKRIDVLKTAGEYSVAASQSQKLVDSFASSNVPDNVRSQAYQRLGENLFLAKADSSEAWSALSEAQKLDPNNVFALASQDYFTYAQLSSVSAAASDESRATFQDLTLLTGDLGGDNGWQRISDVARIVGSPYTTSYVLSNFDGYLDQAGVNIAEADRIGIAADQLSLLVENGVTLSSYSESIFADRFMAVYESNDLGDIVSVDKMQNIFDSQSYIHGRDSYLNNLKTALQESGYNIDSPQLQERIFDTMKVMSLISETTQGNSRDPTLASLMYGTDFVPIGDRLGKPIELDNGEYAGLFAADVVLNPLNLIGAGFAARGAVASKMGLKLALLNQGIKSGSVNAAKAWSSISSQQLARAYMTEIIVDGVASVGLVNLAEINPELAKSVGLGLGLVAGSSVFKGGFKSLAGDNLGVKIFSDLSDTDIFVRNAWEREAIRKKFGGTEVDGVLKTTVDGKEVSVTVGDVKGKYELDVVQKLGVQAQGSIAKKVQENFEGFVGVVDAYIHGVPLDETFLGKVRDPFDGTLRARDEVVFNIYAIGEVRGELISANALGEVSVLTKEGNVIRLDINQLTPSHKRPGSVARLPGRGSIYKVLEVDENYALVSSLDNYNGGQEWVHVNNLGRPSKEDVELASTLIAKDPAAFRSDLVKIDPDYPNKLTIPQEDYLNHGNYHNLEGDDRLKFLETYRDLTTSLGRARLDPSLVGDTKRMLGPSVSVDGKFGGSTRIQYAEDLVISKNDYDALARIHKDSPGKLSGETAKLFIDELTYISNHVDFRPNGGNGYVVLPQKIVLETSPGKFSRLDPKDPIQLELLQQYKTTTFETTAKSVQRTGDYSYSSLPEGVGKTVYLSPETVKYQRWIGSSSRGISLRDALTQTRDFMTNPFLEQKVDYLFYLDDLGDHETLQRALIQAPPTLRKNYHDYKNSNLGVTR